MDRTITYLVFNLINFRLSRLVSTEPEINLIISVSTILSYTSLTLFAFKITYKTSSLAIYNSIYITEKYITLFTVT